MNVSRIAKSTSHQIWCRNFIEEQNKSTRKVREFLRKSYIYNPFGNIKEVDNLLKRYERSFWG